MTATRSAPPPNLLRRVVNPIVSRETWTATGFLLATLFVGVWWFLIVTLLAIAGFASLVLVVGVPLVIAAAAVARGAAALERERLATIDVDLDPVVEGPPADLAGWARLRWELANPATYRNVAYIFLAFILGPVWFSLTIVCWSVPISFIATPLLVAIGFEPTASSQAGDWEIAIDSMGQASAIAAAGLVLLPAAPRFIAAMARAHGRIARGLLAPRPPGHAMGPMQTDPVRNQLQEVGQ